MTGGDFPHGTERGYQRGCSCPECRAAHTAYNIRRKHVLAAVTPSELIPHGATGYDRYLCRCPVCTEGWRDRQRDVRQRRRRNWRAAS